jgi:signal transduction histidine kinase
LKRAQTIIERQVTHMALLLDDLLDVARITQGKLQLKKATVGLIDVIDAAVEAVPPGIKCQASRAFLEFAGQSSPSSCRFSTPVTSPL